MGELGWSCVKGLWTVRLGTVGNYVLNRACVQKAIEAAKQLGVWWSVQLDMVRAKLPEFQFPIHSHEGGYLNCIEILRLLFKESFEVLGFTQKSKCYIKNIIKEMSGKPKSKRSRFSINSGPAKVGNSQAVRGDGVAVYRYGVMKITRSTAMLSLRSSPVSLRARGYSTGTGSSTNVLHKLSDLNNRSKCLPNSPIDRDLYKTFILNKEMYLIAYNKLKSKPGMMTPGISPRTLDGLSSETIEKIISQLRSESYSFSPGRRILIKKANGGNRPLTIGNPEEKLVQEVMRMVLEAIYEPTFSEHSLGFRPKKGCHTALRHVFTKFKGCAWWIEGDIKGCFDNIPHDKLMAVLSLKIKDQRFLQLIRKALNAGYLLDKQPIYDIVGTPQGSIISPILANIYLDQLDQYIEVLKKEFDSNGSRKRHPIVRKTQWEMTKAKRSGDTKLIREISIRMRNNPNKLIGSGPKKLMYVRYADDWIIAVNGSYKDSADLLEKVTIYLASLGLTVSAAKTKITNTYKEPALFLGTNIAHSKSVTVSHHRGGRIQRNSGFLVLNAPMERIYSKLKEAGYMKNHRGITRVTWLSLDINQIINLANSIIRGYENYYSFALNKGKLCTYVYFIIRDTVLRTLANKMSLGTRARVIKKYGPEISVYDQNQRDEHNRPKLKSKLYKPSYRINLWDFKRGDVNTNIKALYASGLSPAKLDNLVCSVCGSDYKIEMHHIRAMKDIKDKKGSLDYLMSSNNRKQIAVCRDCHMKYHSSNKTNK